MNDYYVEARNLGKSFNGKPVLEDLNLEVRPGEVVGVLGLNGAGKTTLLDILLGYSPATIGEARVFGHPALHLPGKFKLRIGYVPQQDELIESLCAADHLRVIGSFYPTWDQEWLETLAGEWQVDLQARIRSMSTGQRQKLSILTALGHRPDLLVLDEPVASLDPVARRQFLQQIIDVTTDARRAVIFSSHIVSDIERLASRIWILKDRRLFWCGEIDSLKDTVVRIHFRQSGVGNGVVAIPNTLHRDQGEDYVSVVVNNWSEGLHREIRTLTGSTPEIEALDLEEIFLELHR